MTLPSLGRGPAWLIGVISPAGVLLAVGPYAPVIVVAMAVVLLAIIVGLIYPAVWSRHTPRRKSALEVLRVLLRR